MSKIQEIKDFWRIEVHNGYDDIVEVKQMAYSDIFDLITIIEEERKEFSRFKKEARANENNNHFYKFHHFNNIR